MIRTMLVIVAILAVPLEAGAQGLEAATGAAVASGTLRELAQDAQQLANTIQAESTLTSFNVRSDLIILAENLKRLAVELEGKLIRDLTQTEQTFIADIRTMLQEARDGTADALTRAEQVILSAGQETSRFPGVANTAFVTSVRPAFAVVDLQKAEAVEVVVSGTLLGRGTQTLAFAGKACQTLQATERNVRFRCKARDLWPNASGSWAMGSLVIARDAAWWQLWKSDEQSIYPAAIRKIDRILGHVTARATVTERAQSRVGRSEEREVRSGPCEDRTANWPFNPVAGCTIDVTSIRAVPGPVSSRSSFNGIQNQSESGFIVQGISRGSGERVLGRCVGGGRGVVIARTSWVDVCPEDVQKALVITEKTPLAWGSDLVIDLPMGSDGFLVSVLQADGREKSFTSAGISDWITVEHDAVAHRLLVRSKPLEQAFSCGAVGGGC